MSPRIAFSVFLFLGATIGPTVGEAQQKFLWQAEVTSDHLRVFTEVSAHNELVMQLRKGNVVNVVLEISVLGDKWCRVALGGESEPVGYTLCKELKPLRSAVKQGSQIEPVILTHRQPIASTTAAERPAERAAAKLGMLTNKDILEMISAGLPESVLVAKIKSSACDFDTTPSGLKELKLDGLPDSVILAIVEAPAGQPRATLAAETPVATTAVAVGAKTAPSDGKIRVLVTDSQSWEMRGGGSAGGNRNGWAGSSSFSGGARPQTAEIIKTLNERCPQITVTNRLDKADFVLTLDHEGGKGLLMRRNKIAVFNKDGDDIMSRSTRSLGNSVKDACEAILSAKR